MLVGAQPTSPAANTTEPNTAPLNSGATAIGEGATATGGATGVGPSQTSVLSGTTGNHQLTTALQRAVSTSLFIQINV